MLRSSTVALLAGVSLAALAPTTEACARRRRWPFRRLAAGISAAISFEGRPEFRAPEREMREEMRRPEEERRPAEDARRDDDHRDDVDRHDAAGDHRDDADRARDDADRAARRPARPRQPGTRPAPARECRPLGPQPVLEQSVRRPHLQLQRLPLRLGWRGVLAVRLRRHLLLRLVAQRRPARVLELRSQLHPVGAVLAQRRLPMAAGLRRLRLRHLLRVRARGASGRLQRRPRRCQRRGADAAGDLERGRRRRAAALRRASARCRWTRSSRR